MEKQSSRPRVDALLLLLLLFFSGLHLATAARLLSPLLRKEDGDEAQVEVDRQDKMLDSEFYPQMTGVELGCGEDGENNGNAEEECLQRRMLRDAHLDYIYTQRHHNP